MELPSLALETGSDCPCGHLVGFYETDAFLVDTVCTLLAPALRDGEVAIVVATAVHRELFESALGDAGIDVGAATREGRYVAFDAATLLERFMVAGEPDPDLFHETIGAVMDGASHPGGSIRVYGEMVALLLDDGDSASALALGDLWNDLAANRSFLLLCAYPMRAFEDEASTAAFKRICDQHTAVIPSEGYSLLADPVERMRAVAQLQQQAAVLGPEVLRLREQVRDQTGAQRDRAGEERDRVGGSRDEAGVQRDQAGHQRDRAGHQRDRAGVQRDQAAEHRDVAADQRDEAADQRDEAAVRSEASGGRRRVPDRPTRSAVARQEAASDRRRASQDRRAGASERLEAELDRETALSDRGAGATERTHAELDRGIALSDRGASAKEREDSSHDDLTGAYHRGAGFVELDREIARARRGQEPLVVAFVDVDGLKAINDSGGHAAGDRMLVEVANAIRATLRSYDLVIRYGGDEFVCVVSGLNMAEATKRTALVNRALAEAPEPGSVTVGLAELQSGESPADLVARADADLYKQRLRRPTNARSTRTEQVL